MTVATAATPLPINLLDYNRQGLSELMQTWGEKPYRGGQVLQWMHQQRVSIAAMSNLSKALRQRLQTQAAIQPPQLLREELSADGTRKWLFKLADGNAIETVFIPEDSRGTLCVSSQVGCALNCSFCSTAKQGFNRNLSVAEIIGQVRQAEMLLDSSEFARDRAVTNVVMMGMGEPLLNFDNVVTAMDIMMDDLGYGLSKRRVTLSTSGVVPAMLRLRECSDVALAVSLHAPNDELRNQLVPINKKYPLVQLMEVCRHYFDGHVRRRITFEYVMLDGVNDTVQHAKQLVRLLADIPCKVNLIPFNPFPMTPYRCSTHSAIERFSQRLQAAQINTIVRRTRGDDINAACGQLVGKFQDRTPRSRKYLKQAIERQEAQ